MAAGNRAAVFAAATELFSTRGWSATGMRDIATAAGVSVETVYGAAGSKRALLLRVLDIAIVGDDEPVAQADRPEFQAMALGTRADRIDAAVAVIATSNQRTARLMRVFAHAAAGEADLAAAWREAQMRRRLTYARGAQMVSGREPHADVVDTLWALGSHEVYLHLVELAGWNPEKYRKWLAEQINRSIAPDPEEKP